MLAAASIAGATLALAAGGYAWAAKSPTSQLFGKTIVAGPDPDEFALTYDDGPNDDCTRALLDVLARHQVRATFFMIGSFVRDCGELARTVRAAGHLVGNHTFTHPALLYQSPRRVREELASTSAALEDALGEPARYFRPPFGSRRPDVLRAVRELGLVPVMWNAMGFDWRPAATPETIVANLDRGIRRNRARGRGSNLLLHDGRHSGIGVDRARTVAATDLLLSRNEPGAVRFVTVDHWDRRAEPHAASAAPN